MIHVCRALLLSAALCLHCAGETSFQLEGAKDIGAPPPSTAADCQAVARAECRYAQRCFPLRHRMDYPDEATCERREQLACQLEVDSKGFSEDAGLSSCALPDDFPCPGDPRKGDAEQAFAADCSLKFHSSPADSPCRTHLHCSTDARCGFEEHNCGTCSGGAVRCTPSPSQTCRKLGDRCGSAQEVCNDGYGECRDGLCTTQLALGDHCDVDPTTVVGRDPRVCPSFDMFCNEGICSTQTLVWSATFPTCAPPPDAGNVTCFPLPVADGAPCIPSLPLCGYPAKCISGYCQYPPKACGS